MLNLDRGFVKVWFGPEPANKAAGRGPAGASPVEPARARPRRFGLRLNQMAVLSRKRLPVWRTLTLMLSDVIAITLGLCVTYWIRFHSGWIDVSKGFIADDYQAIFPWAVLIWFLSLRFENLYRRRMRVFDFNVVRRIITGSCLALLILIAWNFYNKMGEYSRLASLIMMGAVVAMLIANRLVMNVLFQWLLLRRGVGQSRTVVLGCGPIAESICRSLLSHPEWGMQPIGMVAGHSERRPEHVVPGIPVLGTLKNLEALLSEHRADEVILTEPELERSEIPHLLVECERAMAEFRIVPETTELLLSGMTVETLDGIPLLGIRETPLQGWNAALKRMVDFSAALVGLMLTAPLIGLLAWLIRRQDGMSPFYVQERMGNDGRLFNIIKLRTMRPDAEEQSGPIFATDRDERCTPLGMLLRRTHLDELPQLINVLRGDMSLVGPRPERPFFVEQFRDNVPRYMARHKVKSGITGWAQIHGLCGRHGSISERLKYDLYYIENWSLWLDIKILARTVFGAIRPGPV